MSKAILNAKRNGFDTPNSDMKVIEEAFELITYYENLGIEFDLLNYKTKNKDK